AGALRAVRGGGQAPARGGPSLPGVRVRHAVLARVQPPRCTRRPVTRRAPGLRAAHPAPGRSGCPRARGAGGPGRGARVSRDLLFEIGTEELPAWYVSDGSRALGELLRERLEAVGLAPESVTVYATPRRLAAVATEIPDTSAQRVTDRRGPGAAIAFDAEGVPTRAAESFARSSGVDVSDLDRRETERGEYVYARVVSGGEPAEEVLPALLAELVRDLPASRKMRWADVETAFVRPVS